MEFLGQDYLAKRIKDNQKFLLKLLNFHIGKYYPLRKWLGISFRGKIDDISHLSFGYNTKYFQKEGKWYEQQTREYQQPDLGYKLNLVLDKIPQLVFPPALLQPAYGLGALAFFFLTQTTYQPGSKDSTIRQDNPNYSPGLDNTINIYSYTGSLQRAVLEFNISDIPSEATFSQGDLILYYFGKSGSPEGKSISAYKLTRTDWIETQVTWNSYKTGSNWTTAGGDYVTSSPSGGSANIPSSYGWITWNIKSIVEDAYNNSNNVEILMKFTSEGWVAQIFCYSKEEPTETSKRPKLTVTYTVPVSEKSTIALQSTFEKEIKSTASLQSTLEKALKATASLYSLLEKYQVNITALNSLLEKEGKSPVAFISLLEKSQSVTTAIQTLLETLKKSNVALTSQLEGQLKSTTALWTELERILSGADTVALYSLLEKLTYATVSLQTTLEKCKGETVALSTFLQYERTSPVALQSTLEKALKITAAFQSTLEKVLTATVSFQSTLEKAIKNTVALSSTFETKKISTTALLSALERKQQSVVALLTQLEYGRTTTTALYSTLEATKLNTVALYADLNYLRTVSVALKSWLEGVSKGTIALRTLFEKTTQSTIPLLSVLRPFKVKHELDNLTKHTTHIHNIKKL